MAGHSEPFVWYPRTDQSTTFPAREREATHAQNGTGDPARPFRGPWHLRRGAVGGRLFGPLS
ncbi:protein of unknown function (plasmid) [Azospirillum baldaniorum]|uniref:Uncharacterized protein n=1 Tax=Azospirillum baldaniorum TaxID=1064539 RepID=A0A9P1JVW7_9PROT|nr:protein of unknown function [Azospirillum baldaniorum]